MCGDEGELMRRGRSKRIMEEKVNAICCLMQNLDFTHIYIIQNFRAKEGLFEEQEGQWGKKDSKRGQ